LETNERRRTMLEKSKAYSGIGVENLKEAERFYGETLGLNTEVVDPDNLMTLHHAGDRDTLVYQQEGTTPASYTVLNFPVDDIDKAVDELAGRGVSFERYDGFDQDEKGVLRGRAAGQGPDIAWFKDPTGNVLSVLQES
jgi:catechol 2,3-dioxygenase-like lactoylglutathione lyase family enzyme